MFNLMDLLGALSNAPGGQNYYTKGNNSKRWQMCVALLKMGWTISEWKKKDDQDYKDDVVTTWSQKGYENIEIILSYFDQYAWFDYMQRQGDKNEPKLK